MIIQSKKTGKVSEIPASQWEEMKKRGEYNFFNVIDATDQHLEVREIRVEPIELMDEKIDDDLADGGNVTKERGIDFYKEALDDMGVTYHWNSGLDKLKKLYEENI